MFGPRTPAPQVDAQPLAPLGDGGARVTLAAIGDRFVALPLAGAAASKAGFVPADGLAAPAGPPCASRPVRPLSPPRPTLVVAGCDPALPLLEAPLGLLDPPVSFAWWQCASGAALELAARGLVHAAGAHLRSGPGDYNVGSARTVLRQGAEVIGFCAWREGLVLRPGARRVRHHRRHQGRAAAGQPGTGVGGAAAAGPGAGRGRGRPRPAARLRQPGHRAPARRVGRRRRAGRRGRGQRACCAGLRPGVHPARR